MLPNYSPVFKAPPFLTCRLSAGQISRRSYSTMKALRLPPLFS